MKKTLATVVLTIGTVAMLAGCGGASNSSNDNSTSTNSTASTVDASLKQQLVSVNAAAQTAMDDFKAGTTIEGDMDTATIGGQSYDVVATSQAALDSLKTHYLDFMTSTAADTMFKDVVQKGDKFVILPSTTADDLNWYKATVSDVKTSNDGSYTVTLSVPSSKDSTTATKQVKLLKDSKGHLVFDSMSN